MLFMINNIFHVGIYDKRRDEEINFVWWMAFVVYHTQHCLLFDIILSLLGKLQGQANKLESSKSNIYKRTMLMS